jgi:hypothetical protein
MISKNQGPSETHSENDEKDINLKIDRYMNISYKIYENISLKLTFQFKLVDSIIILTFLSREWIDSICSIFR